MRACNGGDAGACKQPLQTSTRMRTRPVRDLADIHTRTDSSLFPSTCSRLWLAVETRRQGRVNCDGCGCGFGIGVGIAMYSAFWLRPDSVGSCSPVRRPTDGPTTRSVDGSSKREGGRRCKRGRKRGQIKLCLDIHCPKRPGVDESSQRRLEARDGSLRRALVA